MESYREELVANAKKLCATGKGLLAADESTGTIGKRFAGIDVENNQDNRRRYRELLFRTQGPWENFISGVILFEETLFDHAEDGTPLVDLLTARGVIPGIKTDKGLVDVVGSPGEQFTRGLDTLAERSARFYAQGARFAKWRNVYRIVDGKGPSEMVIEHNARTLAQYARISQENGLVPVVEPEILMDGEHDIDVSHRVSRSVLAAVYKALADEHVILSGSVLKPSMVHAGSDSGAEDSAEVVARHTVDVLRETVPPAVPGILFLSGGLSEQEATDNLAAMNALPKEERPWALTFSYGRALQASCLQAWRGDDDQTEAAQEAFLARAKANGVAAGFEESED